MAFELNGVVRFLIARIKTTPGLSALVPGGVWYQMAPQGARTPYVVISYQGAAENNSGDGTAIIDARFMVKVVGGGPASANDTFTNAGDPLSDQAVFDAVDGALKGVQAEQIDLPVAQGQAPGANGYVRLTVRGAGWISYTEADGKVRYNHNGRSYRVTVRPGHN